ncbi:MAG TPA: hypothetical protein VGB72_04755 [Acidobacteriota bacterium]
MSEERRKILEMLAQGKISVDEAERLMAALGDSGPDKTEGTDGIAGHKYLRVLVEPGPKSETNEKVNIRVPMKLIRAGLKWAAFMPKQAQDKVDEALKEKGFNIDLSKIKPEDLEELVVHLNDLQVDIEGREKVRIFCE